MSTQSSSNAPATALSSRRGSPRRSTPRRTRQRDAISALLSSHPGFVSAQRIHALLAQSDVQVGLATVYRTLAQMAAGGHVDTIVSDSGEVLYRQCSQAHHHHLVCRHCGTTVEVRDAQVETWAENVARAHGFAEVQHRVEVMGLCGACAPAL